MRARAILAAGLLFVMPLALRPSPAAAVTKVPVSFTVTNPGDPGNGSYTVKGFLMRPDGCTSSSVLLALHGLSYGQWAWDFPVDGYSVAQALAARGYSMIAIDELGYGTSAGDEDTAQTQPNGYTLSVEAYADMTAQIISQIRGGGSYGGPAFTRVGVIGHSAGSEIAELTTELYPDLVDALIATAYTHEPFVNNDWLQREWFQDNIRAAQDDYEYFETSEQIRADDMYNNVPAFADKAVVDLDNRMANLTPSGEVFSIGSQPSRFALATIKKPVLLLLAERDTLFPGSFGESELQYFSGTPDTTLKILPDAGHVFMLHKNAAVGNDMIADWLDARPAAVPSC
ncbi:MAG: alpha/beta hydrolase [Actinomycetota bacterium]